MKKAHRFQVIIDLLIVLYGVCDLRLSGGLLSTSHCNQCGDGMFPLLLHHLRDLISASVPPTWCLKHISLKPVQICRHLSGHSRNWPSFCWKCEGRWSSPTGESESQVLYRAPRGTFGKGYDTSASSRIEKSHFRYLFTKIYI